MIETNRAALIMIDMQNGFISPSSMLCVAGAQATLPACTSMLNAARKANMTVFHVRRRYARDGRDVEPARYEAWLAGGRPLSLAADDEASLDCPDVLTPADGERVLVKPSYSAFFGTSLHNALNKAGINTVILMGTATPNCVRATCYDALSLGYNVAIASDATSSNSPEIQQANLFDMAQAGAQLISSEEFCTTGLSTLRDIAGEVAQMRKENAR